MRRHGAGRDAADIGVMAARGCVEEPRLARLVKNGRDDGDVGQMGAAIVGRIQHEDIAGRHIGVLIDDGAYARAHRTEMHRHVRRIGNEAARPVEHGAGEVETFLDVDR